MYCLEIVIQNEVFCSRSTVPAVNILMVVISEYPFNETLGIYLGGKSKMTFENRTKGRTPSLLVGHSCWGTLCAGL